MTQPPGEFKPSRRDVLRPAEYVGGAAIAAIFTGVITLMVTRDWTLTLIASGGVFIVVLVVLALLAMAVKPDATESAELDGPRAPGALGEPGDAAPGAPGDAAPDSPDGPGRSGH